MRVVWAALMVSLALGGCAGGGAGGGTEAASAEPLPQNYRALVIGRVKTTFFDPYSVRDASISAPIYETGAFDGVTLVPHRGWMVCVRANAKNRMGGYVGSKDTAYLFKGAGIMDHDFAGHLCAKASFQPFPEIEADYRAPSSAPARPARRS